MNSKIIMLILGMLLLVTPVLATKNNQTHNASEIYPKTFSTGNYIFPDNITVDYIFANGTGLTDLNRNVLTIWFNDNITGGNVGFSFNITSSFIKANGSELTDLNRSIIITELGENRSKKVTFDDIVTTSSGLITQEIFDIGGNNWLQKVSAGGNMNIYNTPNSYFPGNINSTGNLTLADKILFKLGEYIDNLVDGWLRFNSNVNITETTTTKNLNVTEKTILKGDLNITQGKILYIIDSSGNQYGSIYHNGTNFVFDNTYNNFYFKSNITVESVLPKANLTGFIGDTNNRWLEAWINNTHSSAYLSASEMDFIVTNSFPFRWFYNSQLLMNLSTDGDLGLRLGNFTVNEYAQYKDYTAKFHAYNITTPDTNWNNVTWNVTIDNDTTTGFRIDTADNNESIIADIDGIIRFGGCAHPIWEGAGGSNEKVSLRIQVNGGEVKCSQSSIYKSRIANDIDTMKFGGSVDVNSGDVITVQYKVSNTDMNFAGDGDFDDPVSFSIDLEMISRPDG